MGLTLREPHDLILDRRAVARPPPRYRPAIQGGELKVFAYDLMRARRGGRDTARHHGVCNGIRHAAERFRHGVTPVFRQNVPVDAVARDAGRCTGLQPPHAQPQSGQTFT